MTRKDITLISISLGILLVSVYFMFNMLGLGKASQKQTPTSNQNDVTQSEITGKFDTDGTLEKLKSLKDYGGAELTSIGRVNPFGPLN